MAIVPKLMNMTEDYLIPYIWGDFNLMILPGSFPATGMENPLMTYISYANKTKDQLDKSICDTIIHEIVHSWLGNQVTE